jgi:hypothetical protein
VTQTARDNSDRSNKMKERRRKHFGAFRKPHQARDIRLLKQKKLERAKESYSEDEEASG